RSLLPGSRLTPLNEGAADDGVWRTADVDGKGWPFALAATVMHVGEPATRFVISRIDPKQVRAARGKSSAHFGLRVPQVRGPSQLWLSDRAVSLGSVAPTAAAVPLTQSAAAKETAPSSPPRGDAICVDPQGLLLVIHPEKALPSSAAALRSLLEHMRVDGCVYPESAPEILLQGP